jgi:isochorismate pyruvate lyase
MIRPMTLDDIRAGIDRIDDEIVALIARREGLVRAAGALKADAHAVRAPDRVEQVVAGARLRAVEAGADPEVVEQVYRAMITAFIALELTEHRKR